MEKSESPQPSPLPFVLLKAGFPERGFWLLMRRVGILPAVNPNTCSSTRSERLARFFNKKEITLPAGSPCNEFKGYCDVFMKCRLVDADGPLARLKKAIFNPELYENIAEWIVVRAWSVTTETALGIVSRRLWFSDVFFLSLHSPGSLVGCATDGNRAHHAHGWLHQDL